MTTTARVTVTLDRARPEVLRHGDEYRGRLLHLARRGLVVVPECRDRSGWRCSVVARRDGPGGTAQVWVDRVELATADTDLTVDGDTDPDVFTMAWQAALWLAFPGGWISRLAGVLIERARIPGTLNVALNEASTRRVQNRAHLTALAVGRLLSRLLDAGFLAAERPTTDGHVYRLSLNGLSNAAGPGAEFREETHSPGDTGSSPR